MYCHLLIELWFNNCCKICVKKYVKSFSGKHKNLIKFIKSFLRKYGKHFIFIQFAIFNHSEKKVEFYSLHYHFIKYKDYYFNHFFEIGV